MLPCLLLTSFSSLYLLIFSLPPCLLLTSLSSLYLLIFSLPPYLLFTSFSSPYLLLFSLPPSPFPLVLLMVLSLTSTPSSPPPVILFSLYLPYSLFIPSVICFSFSSPTPFLLLCPPLSRLDKSPSTKSDQGLCSWLCVWHTRMSS